MPSKGSITRTIRLNLEDKAYVYKFMEDNKVTLNGAIHRIIRMADIVHEPSSGLMDRAVERELVRLCNANGITTHEFFRGVMEQFLKNRIRVDQRGVRTVGKLDTERLEEICYKRKLDPQDVVNRLNRKLWEK